MEERSGGSDASRPRGRRPGPSTTRESILEAARQRFALDGFRGATVRAIATDAGVDPALVIQSFGSKDKLFGAVLSISFETLSEIADAFSGPAEGIGERVARTYLTIWQNEPSDAEALRAMLRSAIDNNQANAQLREFIESRVTEDVDRSARDEDAAAVRISLAASMLVGVTIGREILSVSFLADERTDTIVAMLAPALQEVLAPASHRL